MCDVIQKSGILPKFVSVCFISSARLDEVWLKIFQILLKTSLNFNTVDEGLRNTPLHHACISMIGLLEVVTLLFDNLAKKGSM